MRRLDRLVLPVLLAASCRDAPTPPGGAAPRHVLFLHLDGYRGDLTRSLLEAGRLPHLALLASSGRVAYDATTVDKSETMKVVQSYLTSQLDTSVAGWWQFDRSDFRFRNYWLDPAEVLSYALGLTFPTSPTLQDFLAARGENLVAGMSLARRSVPFENYGRAYVEGIEAVGGHTYHRQAHATMSAFLDIHRSIAERGEKSPALSTLVLAAADEFSHLEGATTESPDSEHCFRRGEGDDTVFRLLDEDAEHPHGGRLRELESRYFSRVRRGALGGGAREVCVQLPEIEGSDGRPKRAEPHYVLSMTVLDIELGYLVDFFQSLRFGPDGERRFERPERLQEPPADSLFESTLFLAFGDHGMVDTPHGLGDGSRASFLADLGEKLGLATPDAAGRVPEAAELGIDYFTLPGRLQEPELHPDWQAPEVREETRRAQVWAEETVRALRDLISEGLHESYWWLFFLRSILIEPKLDEAAAEFSGRAERMLRQLYLRSIESYRTAELEANRAYFDRRVRLVYGGGARNNAELFLPACGAEDGCTWRRRPSYDEIVSYRDGALLRALEAQPAVGLVFIRKNNEAFEAGAPLPEGTDIEVRDREANRGTIGVRREGETGELLFHYRTEPGSARDPLGYDRFGRGEGTWGTYNEWNDRTVAETYVNAVAGIGAYLFSDNPAVGDVLALHATDWNFGDNRGGHGGLHRLEKTTFLLASGPGVAPGELRSRSRFTGATGSIEPAPAGARHVPTLLDLTPTALEWLGHSSGDLERFGREEFPELLDAWIRSQRGDILGRLDGMRDLDALRTEAGVEELSLSPLLPRISRLLAFVESDREPTLRRLEARPLLGNVLDLR